mmetsp:Transcript_1860/g.4240  ORF Transcript_1860/g.4240 Transcript_1860/m.4240 type:complete len:226 (+) Transcript_1860:1731-2408(+)
MAARAASFCQTKPALAALGDRFQSTPSANSRISGLLLFAASRTTCLVEASLHIAWRFVGSAARLQSEPKAARRQASSWGSSRPAAATKTALAPSTSSHMRLLLSALVAMYWSVLSAIVRASRSSSPDRAAACRKALYSKPASCFVWPASSASPPGGRGAAPSGLPTRCGAVGGGETMSKPPDFGRNSASPSICPRLGERLCTLMTETCSSSLSEAAQKQQDEESS